MTGPVPAPSRSRAQFDALAPFLGSIGSLSGEDLILKPDKPLYHYTDLPGLIGIVKSGGLWLTHSQFSNDSEEFTLGQRIVREVIAERKGELAANPAATELLDLIEKLVGTLAADGVYICCFCRKENLLSQWRGYGSNGGGVCIEFDPAEFGYLTGVDCPNGLLRLWPVFYEETRQRRIINKAIDHALLLPPAGDPVALNARAQETADTIQFFIPTFKNEDFGEEDESRLIFTPDPSCTAPLHFRSGRGLLTPYYELREVSPAMQAPVPAPFPPRLPIRRVTVGPSTNRDSNVAGVRMLLKAHGYGPEVEVIPSKTPYRG